jgi:hypothetical protein
MPLQNAGLYTQLEKEDPEVYRLIVRPGLSACPFAENAGLHSNSRPGANFRSLSASDANDQSNLF